MNSDKLSLRAKIGQMFMVGIVDDAHLYNLVRAHGVGGIIYFSRNGVSAQEAYTFFKKAENLALVPLFKAVDQEGGTVTRIKEGVTSISGQMAIGATGVVANAQTAAEILATELSGLGLNMILGPVVDVNNNPHNPVINVRSFGEDPFKVAEFASAALKGYRSKGLLAVAKHYPGHGDTSRDSHLDLPIVSHELEHLYAIELKPFVRLIREGVPGIMVSHVLFEALDSERPATLSKAVINDLLRETLHYNGLILTDCMEMDAISKRYTPEESAIESVLAGADILLYSAHQEVQVRAIEAVYSAVKSGQISIERINASIDRIFRYKRWIKQQVVAWPEQELKTSASIERSLNIARASITLVGTCPFPLNAVEQVAIFESTLLKTYFPDAVLYDAYDPAYCTLVFYKQRTDLKGIIDKLNPQKTVLVAVGSPYETIDCFTTVFTYELTALALEGLLYVLSGNRAKGYLPIINDRKM